MRDRKFITDPRDTPGLCTRGKIRHFRASLFKTRLCTQAQLQLISLPSLLALQPSVTSKVTQKLSPKVHIMLTTKLHILYGPKDRTSSSHMV